MSIIDQSCKQLRPMLQDQDLKCQDQDQHCRISVSSDCVDQDCVIIWPLFQVSSIRVPPL